MWWDMTLKDIQTAIDALSFEEIKQLRAYLEQRETDLQPGRGKTPQERIRLLHEAVTEIREGLTQEELDQLTEDMNSEYIEDVDVDVWRD